MRRTFSTRSRRQYSTTQSNPMLGLGTLIQHWSRTVAKDTIKAPLAAPPRLSSPSCTTQAVSSETREHIRLAMLLDSHPELAQRVVERLSPDRRRHFLVAASASEWYGTNLVSSKIEQADADGDARISSSDYRQWIQSSLERKSSYLSWKTLVFVAINAGAPFVAFGFLDNSMMILCGDAIDGAFGERFALSAMGTAALGGICSGALGIQFHGVTQRVVNYFIPAQEVTAGGGASASHIKYLTRSKRLGATCGIALGLSLGMLPLWFV